jgi:hypothetical protein
MAPTLLEGNRVRVSITGNAVKIDESNLILTDVAATNGVIHVLDQVLLPTGKVTKLTLVNAQTGADIQTIEAGATIDLGTSSAGQVSVRADVFPQAVGSVTIASMARPHRELPALLAAGRLLPANPVTYNPWNRASGTFTITATLTRGLRGRARPAFTSR